MDGVDGAGWTDWPSPLPLLCESGAVLITNDNYIGLSRVPKWLNGEKVVLGCRW
jgi:hypothetical protein